MQADLELEREEDAPSSGVFLRTLALPYEPYEAPSVPVEERPANRSVLAEAMEEVFFDVFDHVRALSPLQGPWLGLGVGQLNSALRVASAWREPIDTAALRRRWPELVPGSAAMDRLANLLVDLLYR